MKEYDAPEVTVIASFHEATRGLWFGDYVDALGAKAYFGW